MPAQFQELERAGSFSLVIVPPYHPMATKSYRVINTTGAGQTYRDFKKLNLARRFYRRLTQ